MFSYPAGDANGDIPYIALHQGKLSSDGPGRAQENIWTLQQTAVGELFMACIPLHYLPGH